MHYQLPPSCYPFMFPPRSLLPPSPLSHFSLPLSHTSPSLPLSLPLIPPSLSHSPSYVSLYHYISLFPLPLSHFSLTPLSLASPSLICPLIPHPMYHSIIKDISLPHTSFSLPLSLSLSLRLSLSSLPLSHSSLMHYQLPPPYYPQIV